MVWWQTIPFPYSGIYSTVNREWSGFCGKGISGCTTKLKSGQGYSDFCGTRSATFIDKICPQLDKFLVENLVYYSGRFLLGL